jgi:hypothetical protein
MTKSYPVVAVACLAVFVLAAQAGASDITFNGLAYNKAVQINHESSTLNVLAGAFLIDIDNGGVNQVAYCVDLDHWLYSPWTATFGPVTSVNNGLAAAYLYDHFAGTVKSDVAAAGLQVAIWEVVEDCGKGLNLSSGDFQLSGADDVRGAAQNFLAALPADVSGYTTGSFVLHSGVSPQSQNLIVPEPGTTALLVGSVLVLFCRRRFAKRLAAAEPGNR